MDKSDRHTRVLGNIINLQTPHTEYTSPRKIFNIIRKTKPLKHKSQKSSKKAIVQLTCILNVSHKNNTFWKLENTLKPK